MSEQLQTFLKAAETKTADLQHRKTLRFNIGKYDATVVKGKAQYANMEAAQQLAKNRKWEAIENLATHLETFEKRFTQRGGKVIWAETAEQAMQAILDIAEAQNAQSVVKAKSMTTEEIELNEHLEAQKITVYETDLGEFIVQLAGEKPYHIVTPAMHKSKDDVAQLFHEKLDTSLELSAQELTLVARRALREKYMKADIGISGANFIVADIGGIAITENEGNARLSVSYPKTHIAIVGIEKIIPSINHLGDFWSLLATYGTGQKVTVYNSIVLGPRQEGEPDGPENMYVILLDNGRTSLLAQPKKREALHCIRCGACLNACPVYKNIGGHAYGATYSGPIGSVITPNLKGMADYGHLSQASSLCGNCTEVCPMKIDLHNHLLANRKDSIQQGHGLKTDQWIWSSWKKAMLSRRLMNLGGSGVKNFLLNTFFQESWGNQRELPKMAKKSFNQLWRKGKV